MWRSLISGCNLFITGSNSNLLVYDLPTDYNMLFLTEEDTGLELEDEDGHEKKSLAKFW